MSGEGWGGGGEAERKQLVSVWLSRQRETKNMVKNAPRNIDQAAGYSPRLAIGVKPSTKRVDQNRPGRFRWMVGSDMHFLPDGKRSASSVDVELHIVTHKRQQAQDGRLSRAKIRIVASEVRQHLISQALSGEDRRLEFPVLI